MHRFSDSDDDGRDASLDMQFGNYGSSYQTSNTRGGPNIASNSQYDRSFTFSDDDDDDVGAPMQTTAMMSNPINRNIGAPVRSSFSDDEDSGLAGYNPGTMDMGGDMDDDLTPAGMGALFSLITKFQPEPVDITVHWKPFIPELVPSIGAIDAFIKVPRPDGELDDLGLTIIDEPSIAQSNPQVLRMELREQYGVTSPGNESDGYIGAIEDPQKNRKALESWLESIEDIHRKRPPPVMMYSQKMPEMEELMEPFSPKFEETLKSLVLPTSEIDLGFDEYARVICALLEIPVNGNIIESLHHLFSLYSAFAGNTYFQSETD